MLVGQLCLCHQDFLVIFLISLLFSRFFFLGSDMKNALVILVPLFTRCVHGFCMLDGGGRSSGSSSSSSSSRSSSRGGIMGGRQDGDGGGDGDDDDFSDEEELARENALLQRRLENDLDEVKRIETKMAEVAEVMQMFSAELTKQHDSIMQLEENADKSQQEIVKANRKLTSANEHKRGGRHFTVMVLVTASFVLLFLHWFAD